MIYIVVKKYERTLSAFNNTITTYHDHDDCAVVPL